MRLFGANRGPIPADQVVNVVAPRDVVAPTERLTPEARLQSVLKLVADAWMEESLLHEEDRNVALLDLCTDIRNAIAVPVIPGRSS